MARGRLRREGLAACGSHRGCSCSLVLRGFIRLVTSRHIQRHLSYISTCGAVLAINGLTNRKGLTIYVPSAYFADEIVHQQEIGLLNKRWTCCSIHICWLCRASISMTVLFQGTTEEWLPHSPTSFPVFLSTGHSCFAAECAIGGWLPVRWHLRRCVGRCRRCRPPYLQRD